MTIWGKLYHKSVFNSIWFPTDRLHEDEYFTYKVLYQAKDIYYTNAIFYFYVFRNSSLTTSYTYKDLQDKYDALDERIHFFNQKNETLLSNRAVITLAYFFISLFSRNNKKINKRTGLICSTNKNKNFKS